jgi:hypothetical protein
MTKEEREFVEFLEFVGFVEIATHLSDARNDKKGGRQNDRM